MKLILTMTLLLSAGALSASDKAYYFGTILEKFKSSNIVFDISVYKKVLISGRCFSPRSQQAYGSALILNTQNVDSGPIGLPSDTVTTGFILYNADSGAYDRYNYYSILGEFPELKKKFVEVEYMENAGQVIESTVLRQGSDGIIYATAYYPGSDQITSACYYYGNRS